MFQRSGNPDLSQRNGGRRKDELATVHSSKEVAAHAQALFRLSLELAVREVREKAATAATGAGFGAAAALFGVLATGFAFAALAAGLATTLPVWLSILIVTVLLAALAALAGFVAVKLLKRATPPVPERAIREAKLTRDAVSGL